MLLIGCSENTSTQSLTPPGDDTPLADPDRPADPGLSFELACLGKLPLDLDLRAGSRPITGIPAVTDPKFLSPNQVTYLQDGDLVFGVEIAGRFFAFPARILNYHEVTTFSVDDYRYAATW